MSSFLDNHRKATGTTLRNATLYLATHVLIIAFISSLIFETAVGRPLLFFGEDKEGEGVSEGGGGDGGERRQRGWGEREGGQE